ncbi:MAG TPA: CDP-diacylglycerol diphosphatase [Acetobacteraceae bacterium]|nr:CDP-diacylglycerol diphosphatase [Acetobacteraceae bacterium]
MTRTILWLILASGISLTAHAANPSALWHVVHDRCVPDEQMHDDPAPCRAVDIGAGYAVLKDIVGNTQYLLIPTARVGGIEDKAILAPYAPNYFAQAWQAAAYLRERIGRDIPRTDIALAINSVHGRTQNQLHIHIDCIRPDVQKTLEQYKATIGPDWAAFPEPLVGQRYRAMRLVQPELGGTNPFRLLAKVVPQPQMGSNTLVLVGAEFGNKPGFILLDGRADPAAGDTGSGEALQDHSCAIAQ